MTDAPRSEELVDKRYLILVMRLLVSGQGELQYGELVDVSGLTVGTFRELDEVRGLVGRWLAEWTPEQSAADRESVRPKKAGG